MNKCCICKQEIGPEGGYCAEPLMIGTCCDVCFFMLVQPLRRTLENGKSDRQVIDFYSRTGK